MRYGKFNDQSREYVIERPDTPMSWVNYLGTDQYCSIVSNNAAGYAFHQSPRSGRLLRFRFNSVPTDRPGRYFYLRDAEDGDIWSVTWQPVAKPFRTPDGEVVGAREAGEPAAEYECVHAPGVSTFRCQYRDVSARLRAFVPLGESAEVWELTLHNEGGERRTLDLFGYVEWCFWHIQQDAFNFQYILYTCRMAEAEGIIDYSLQLWPFEEPKAYFASTAPVDSFDTDREAFLGNYRHEGQPVAVEKGRCSNSVALGGTPCGALHSRVTLEAGETRTITFICGVGDAKTVGRKMRERFASEGAVDHALEEIAAYWDERLSKLTLQTPDSATNSMGNVWNQVQCHTTFNWSRSASFNEAGGRDGLGFRDSCQDILGVVHAIPEAVKGKLLDLLRAQYSFGAAMHHVQPLQFKQGYHNVAEQHFSDDHLWLLIAIPAYLRETGHYGFLDEVVIFADEGRASVYEHLKRAIDFSWSKRGPHGFCLGLAADWNDCLNLRGKGESLFSTFLLVRAMREFLILAERTAEKKKERAEDHAHYRRLLDTLLTQIEEYAWDGEWFIRGFVDSGDKIGSRESEGSKIFLNTQSWAVLAQVAEEPRLRQALDAVREHLASEHGAALNAPCYTEHNAEIGAITTFPPGLKENGGIFCHANTWLIVAEALLGRGDLAFEYYRAFLPAAKNDQADLYSMEPYAYAQFITGPEHPYHFGRARNSWLTGTATWGFVALTQYILGVRADYDGLVIQPCVPSDWREFQITREFRGAHYHIRVSGSGKIQEARVQGEVVNLEETGALRVPLAEPGAQIQIELTLTPGESSV